MAVLVEQCQAGSFRFSAEASEAWNPRLEQQVVNSASALVHTLQRDYRGTAVHGRWRRPASFKQLKRQAG